MAFVVVVVVVVGRRRRQDKSFCVVVIRPSVVDNASYVNDRPPESLCTQYIDQNVLWYISYAPNFYTLCSLGSPPTREKRTWIPDALGTWNPSSGRKKKRFVVFFCVCGVWCAFCVWLTNASRSHHHLSPLIIIIFLPYTNSLSTRDNKASQQPQISRRNALIDGFGDIGRNSGNL